MILDLSLMNIIGNIQMKSKISKATIEKSRKEILAQMRELKKQLNDINLSENNDQLNQAKTKYEGKWIHVIKDYGDALTDKELYVYIKSVNSINSVYKSDKRYVFNCSGSEYSINNIFTDSFNKNIDATIDLFNYEPIEFKDWNHILQERKNYWINSVSESYDKTINEVKTFNRKNNKK